jgi:hypothetical protein
LILAKGSKIRQSLAVIAISIVSLSRVHSHGTLFDRCCWRNISITRSSKTCKPKFALSLARLA